MPLFPSSSSGGKLNTHHGQAANTHHGQAAPKPSLFWKKTTTSTIPDSDSTSDIEGSSTSVSARSSLRKQVSFQSRPQQHRSSSFSENNLSVEGSVDSNEELAVPPGSIKVGATKGTSLDVGRDAHRYPIGRKQSCFKASSPASQTEAASSSGVFTKQPKADIENHSTKVPLSSAKRKHFINKNQTPASSVDAPAKTHVRSHAPWDVMSDNSSSVSSRQSSSSSNPSDKSNMSSNIDPFKKLSSIEELTVAHKLTSRTCLLVSPARDRKPSQTVLSNDNTLSSATPSKADTSIAVARESKESLSDTKAQQSQPVVSFRVATKNVFIPPFMSPDTPSDSQSDGLRLNPTRRTHTEETLSSVYNTFVERSMGAGNRSDSQIFKSCKNSSSEHFKSCSNSDTNVWLQ